MILSPAVPQLPSLKPKQLCYFVYLMCVKLKTFIIWLVSLNPNANMVQTTSHKAWHKPGCFLANFEMV